MRSAPGQSFPAVAVMPLAAKVLKQVMVNTGGNKEQVADIVQLNGNIRPRSRQWWQLFRMVSQWHVDVVIVERRSFSIVAAVELDDASHLRPERRRRDILLEEVLRQAGIPLLRSHDARKLLQMTGEWLNTTGADQQSPEHRS